MANLRAILKSSSKIKEYSTTSQDQKINPRVDATVMAIPSLKVKFKPNLLRWVRHGPKAGCTYYDPALAVGFRARVQILTIRFNIKAWPRSPGIPKNYVYKVALWLACLTHPPLAAHRPIRHRYAPIFAALLRQLRWACEQHTAWPSKYIHYK